MASANLVRADQAMQIAAAALDAYAADDIGAVTESVQRDAHAVYAAAAQVFAAARIAEASGIQPYELMAIPAYLKDRFGVDLEEESDD